MTSWLVLALVWLGLCCPQPSSAVITVDSNWSDLSIYEGIINSPSTMLQYVAGFLDADGTVIDIQQTHHRRIVFTQSSQPYLEVLQKIIFEAVPNSTSWPPESVTLVEDPCPPGESDVSRFSGGSDVYRLIYRGQAALRLALALVPYVIIKRKAICDFARLHCATVSDFASMHCSIIAKEALCKARLCDAYIGGFWDGDGCVAFSHLKRSADRPYSTCPMVTLSQSNCDWFLKGVRAYMLDAWHIKITLQKGSQLKAKSLLSVSAFLHRIVEAGCSLRKGWKLLVCCKVWFADSMGRLRCISDWPVFRDMPTFPSSGKPGVSRDHDPRAIQASATDVYLKHGPVLCLHSKPVLDASGKTQRIAKMWKNGRAKFMAPVPRLLKAKPAFAQ